MAPRYEKTQEKGIARLVRGLSSMFISKNFADLQVVLGDRTWLVHRNIVCCRSDFFARACEGPFMQEESEGVVELHDDDPDVIDRLFHYIYRNAYDDADTHTAPVLLNVRMVAVAEKYFVDHLAQLAISKLSQHVAEAWETRGFSDAVEEAYTTTADCDRALRDTLLEIVGEHAHDLFDVEKTKYAHFQTMAARTPVFGSEVAAQQAAALVAYQNLGVYRCPASNCPAVFKSSMEENQSYSWRCHHCGQIRSRYSYSQWQMYRLNVRPGVEEVDGS
ncbi:hypothetical protein LTR74_003011 [Friedmanniomyces endolithicus]|nr:hypothetical protein LTR74_003011 [Friedmanniomyces endolithicus]